MPGQDPSLEKLEVYTKKDEPTKFEVSVKSTSFKSLAEIQAFGFIDRQSILKEAFIEVNNEGVIPLVSCLRINLKMHSERIPRSLLRD